jgi:hypothetical protein
LRTEDDLSSLDLVVFAGASVPGRVLDRLSRALPGAK